MNERPSLEAFAMSDAEKALCECLPDYPPPDVAAPLIVWEYVQALRDRLRRYDKALVAIVVASGADVSDGSIPDYPSLEVWALQAVRTLRADYDDEMTDHESWTPQDGDRAYHCSDESCRLAPHYVKNHDGAWSFSDGRWSLRGFAGHVEGTPESTS